jgi:hypothetical protein
MRRQRSLSAIQQAAVRAPAGPDGGAATASGPLPAAGAPAAGAMPAEPQGPRPASTPGLSLPVSTLLRSASPGPGGRGFSAVPEPAYSAAKAADVPLPKLLRRYWFAVRHAAGTRPGAAAALALALLLLLGLLRAGALRHGAAWRVRAPGVCSSPFADGAPEDLGGGGVAAAE